MNCKLVPNEPSAYTGLPLSPLILGLLFGALLGGCNAEPPPRATPAQESIAQDTQQSIVSERSTQPYKKERGWRVWHLPQEAMQTAEPTPSPARAASAGNEERTTLHLVLTGEMKGWVSRGVLYADRRPAGLAHLAAQLREIRRQHPQRILLDAGDAVHGAPESTLLAEVQGKQPASFPVLDWMNALGYDAMSLGNYDLQLPLSVWQAALQQAHFPWLAANLPTAAQAARFEKAGCENEHSCAKNWTAQSRGGLRSVLWLQRKGVRVAVLGLARAGSRLPAAVGEADRPLVRAASMLPTLRRWVPQLRHAGADLVIALAHSEPADLRGREASLRRGTQPGRELDALAWGFNLPPHARVDLILAGGASRGAPGTRGLRGLRWPQPAYSIPWVQAWPGGEAVQWLRLHLIRSREASLPERTTRWRLERVEVRTLLAQAQASPDSTLPARTLRMQHESTTLLAETTRVRFRRFPSTRAFHRCSQALVFLAAQQRIAQALAPRGEARHASVEPPRLLLPYRWRKPSHWRKKQGEKTHVPLRRADLHRWMPYADTLVQVPLTRQQSWRLLEPARARKRGKRVSGSLVLATQGFVPPLSASARDFASYGAGFVRGWEGDPPQWTWTTAYIAGGGGGLMAQALGARDPLSTPPHRLGPSLREDIFRLLSGTNFQLPAPCRTWLAKR